MAGQPPDNNARPACTCHRCSRLQAVRPPCPTCPGGALCFCPRPAHVCAPTIRAAFPPTDKAWGRIPSLFHWTGTSVGACDRIAPQPSQCQRAPCASKPRKISLDGTTVKCTVVTQPSGRKKSDGKAAVKRPRKVKKIPAAKSDVIDEIADAASEQESMVIATKSLGSEEPSSSAVQIEPTPVASSVHVEPTPVASDIHVEPTPVASDVHVEPTPVASSVHIDPTPVASEAQIEPTPVASDAHVEPTPVASDVHVEPTPVVSSVHIDPTPVASSVHFGPTPVTSEDLAEQNAVPRLRTSSVQTSTEHLRTCSQTAAAPDEIVACDCDEDEKHPSITSSVHIEPTPVVSVSRSEPSRRVYSVDLPTFASSAIVIEPTHTDSVVIIEPIHTHSVTRSEPSRRVYSGVPTPTSSTIISEPSHSEQNAMPRLQTSSVQTSTEHMGKCAKAAAARDEVIVCDCPEDEKHIASSVHIEPTPTSSAIIIEPTHADSVTRSEPLRRVDLPTPASSAVIIEPTDTESVVVIEPTPVTEQDAEDVLRRSSTEEVRKCSKAAAAVTGEEVLCDCPDDQKRFSSIKSATTSTADLAPLGDDAFADTVPILLNDMLGELKAKQSMADKSKIQRSAMQLEDKSDQCSLSCAVQTECRMVQPCTCCICPMAAANFMCPCMTRRAVTCLCDSSASHDSAEDRRLSQRDVSTQRSNNAYSSPTMSQEETRSQADSDNQESAEVIPEIVIRATNECSAMSPLPHSVWCPTGVVPMVLPVTCPACRASMLEAGCRLLWVAGVCRDADPPEGTGANCPRRCHW